MARFSVILPVRNGMPYIKDAVFSVLAQTCNDFSLHILDNNSTDGTLEFLRSIQDERVLISTSSVDLSIEQSWARIRSLRKNEFMTMFAHDDILMPNFLSSINLLIESEPEARLFQTGGSLIDSKGEKIRECQPVSPRESSRDYLRARFMGERDVFGTGYVMRSTDYEFVGGIPMYDRLSFADDALWVKLMGSGYKACCGEDLVRVRIHPESASATSPRNWSGFLIAIRQFSDFLLQLEIENRAAMNDLGALKRAFFKKYLANIYALGCVEKATSRRRFTEAEMRSFKQAYETLVEQKFFSFFFVPKVLALSVILRVYSPLIPKAWKLYQKIRRV